MLIDAKTNGKTIVGRYAAEEVAKETNVGICPINTIKEVIVLITKATRLVIISNNEFKTLII